MTAKPEITERQFQNDLGLLMATGEWRELAKLPMVADSFNLFALLEDAVCENAWSRIIGFLFDSTGNHALGLKPLTFWAADNLPGTFRELVKLAKSSTCDLEWGTFEGRRLDILIRLLNGSGDLSGIIGIENKVWSGEQPNQLGDYQSALIQAFPQVPKILVFLTPDNSREVSTAGDLPECPVQRVFYSSVIKICDQVFPEANGGVRLLVQNLRDYIDRHIVADQAMKNQIRETVSKLYQDEKNREVLNLIFEHRPTTKAVLDQVAASAQKMMKVEKIDYWPEEDDFTPELRIWPNSWKTKGIQVCYMLRSWSKGKPFIGDSFTILVTASCDNETARIRCQKQIVPLLPPKTRSSSQAMELLGSSMGRGERWIKGFGRGRYQTSFKPDGRRHW